MPEPKRKGLVNRQAVGTCRSKLHQRQSGSHGKGEVGAGKRTATEPAEVSGAPKGKTNNVQCDGEVVDVAKLVPDPLNARLHPERNLQAIMESLALYGQRKPIVVRKQTKVVVAGNGTLEAAKLLGWTKIAASVRNMTDDDAIGYGLADNRSAELAKWDFEVVAKLDELINGSGKAMVGWSLEELAVLRGKVGAPVDFPEVDESIETEHRCPKCGYRFSGGS